jgi:dephospho-CoA kinase
VTASTAARQERTKEWEVEPRETRLIPDEEKAKRADFVYLNDGSLEELDAFVAEVMKELRA